MQEYMRTNQASFFQPNKRVSNTLFLARNIFSVEGSNLDVMT